MKIKTNSGKSLNECFGVSNEEYTKLSLDLFNTCVDKLAQDGTLSFVKIANEVLNDIRFKHFGKINSEMSSYELNLFVGGMLIRWLCTDEIEKSIHIKAYAKQLEDGLSNF